jgi:hypothetical protein
MATGRCGVQWTRWVGVALVLVLAAPAWAEAAASCPAPAAAGAAQGVVVGMYVNQVASIDVKGNTFLADFYLWFRWQGDIDPTLTFELVNAIEPWSFAREAVYKDAAGTPHPDVLPDGCKFQQFHIQGRFGHPFELSAYPLDEQLIRIKLEDSKYTSNELVYIGDEKDSRADPALKIPGWTILESRGEVGSRTYATAMGDPRLSALPCTQFRFTMRLGRPLVGYLSKTLVPISFVLLITILIFFVGHKYFEGRLGLAVTNLISAVALQLTTNADLPQVGYLVLVDKLYNFSYLLILFSMFESTLAVRYHDAGNEALAKRLDRGAIGVSVVALLGVMVWVFKG